MSVKLPRLRQWISVTLIVAAFIWLGSLIGKDAPEIASQFTSWSARNSAWLAFSLLLVSLSLIQNYCIYRTLFSAHTLRTWSHRVLLPTYFLSQVVRYLPGRFFGIVYLINEFRSQTTTFAIIRTNLEQMWIFFGGNLIVATAIVFWFAFSPIPALMIVALGLTILSAGIYKNTLNHLIRMAIRILPNRFNSYQEAIDTTSRFSLPQIANILVFYSMSWLAYLGAWLCLWRALPQLNGESPILTCAHYTIAWIVGFVAAITPSGLGIRESVFVSLSELGGSLGNLAFLAIFLRLWLMAADLIMLAFAYLVTTILRNKNVNPGNKP